jgi:hypothetical protein
VIPTVDFLHFHQLIFCAPRNEEPTAIKNNNKNYNPNGMKPDKLQCSSSNSTSDGICMVVCQIKPHFIVLLTVLGT